MFQRTRRVELHRKTSIGDWEKHEVTHGDLILESIAVGHVLMPLEVVYEDINFTNESARVREESPCDDGY